MICVRNVCFHYDNDFQLNIENLEISRGQKVAFIGESGCGKTTFISLLAGILRLTSGEIIIDNKQVSSYSKRQFGLLRLENIGFIFQNFALLDYLNAQQNILLPFTLRNITINKLILDRTNELANSLGIIHKLKAKPSQLSQGEKQRVAIARAMIHRPLIVIADEPTGNLDPQNSEKIMTLLWKELRDDTTFLMVTHDHSLLPKFDRVLQFQTKGLVEL